MEAWDDVPITHINSTETFPEDINHMVKFRIKFDPDNRMESTRDRRPWLPWNTSNRKNFDGVRRKASCNGSLICRNEACDYFKHYQRHNSFQFRPIDRCFWCEKVIKTRTKCDAIKIWEFDYRTGYVTVYHKREHNC